MIDKLIPLSLAVGLLLCWAEVGAGAAETPEEMRSRAKQQMEQGFYKEAAGTFSTLALDRGNPPKDAARDFQNAYRCLGSVGQRDDAARLMDQAEIAWPDSWRMLQAIAELRRYAQNANLRRGRGPWNRDNSLELNRTAALRLMQRAEPLLREKSDPASPAESMAFYQSLADIVMTGREGQLSWRLTTLTNLDDPAAADDETNQWSLARRNAPVDAEGKPILHQVPPSWVAAENDGQRWMWAMDKMAYSGGKNAEAEAQLIRADFLVGQFGVQTLQDGPRLGHASELTGDTGPFAVRTLQDDETIARLASGLKRFNLPNEFNPIILYRRAAAAGDAEIGRKALTQLANIFENRQQYAKALLCWEQYANLRGTAPGFLETAKQAIQRITGNSGVLESGPVAPAGSRTSLPYLFRNGKTVHLTAKRLDEKKLLMDIRSLLKGDAEKLFSDYSLHRPEMLGRRIVENDETRYVAETVAEWDVKLEPLADYYSRRADIPLPFTGAGCYLIEARMEQGNVSRLILWLADLALVRKNAAGSQILFVADAKSGELVPGANLSFLGYENRYDNSRQRNRLLTDEFAERTDKEGLAIVDTARMQQKEWLITATTDDGRLAYLGFDSVWPMHLEQDAPAHNTAFIITDRPAYRPGQPIDFKVWVGKASYAATADAVAGIAVKLTVTDPKGDIVYQRTLPTDAYGGVADTLKLPDNAVLGQYYIHTEYGWGGASFRLEEYKKPEFEVEVETPKEALTLGDSVQVKVKAKYYYGAPVTEGKVGYKIVRTPHEQSWLPPWKWDWLYGSGAWLPAYDYSWYPGWHHWRMHGVRMKWLPVVHVQPELVGEGEGKLDADGVFRLTLDTAAAKALFGNQDHSYEISVEVTDQSRRTITGGGKVVAARDPFNVNVWTDRGFFAAGQEIVANVRSLLPAGGGIKTKGQATLFRVRYDLEKGEPRETAVLSERLETDADGLATVRMKAEAAGQYRLSVRLEDAQANSIEGGTLITVRGKAGEGDYRFSALELIPEKRDYQPGETLRLAVNSENREARVVFLPRAERNGRAGLRADANPVRPQLLRLSGGTTVVEIPVAAADQPNFFCEAIIVYQGRMYVESREIFVPPAAKTLNVEVTPDQPAYAPGAKADFTVKVTDAEGKPAEGQLVVSMYDRSVEYISGGSNVGDIKAHFWNWKRYYNSELLCSLAKQPYSVAKPGDPTWQPIGIFGYQEADWNDADGPAGAVELQGRAGGGRGGARIMRKSMPRAAPPMAMNTFGGANEMVMDAVVAYSAAAPAPAPMAAPAGKLAMAEGAAADSGTGAAGSGPMAETAVRSEFADTAFWTAALLTGADGKAKFTLDMPENLTAWKTRVWTMGSGLRVGEGSEQVETKKNIIVRPQTPRFLTQKDQVILSANLHNYLPRAKNARAELVLEGGLLEAADGVRLTKNVTLAANGEARVDWLVQARRPGEATVIMKLLTDEESDAAEVKVPVIVHGARRVENWGGVLRADDRALVLPVRVPAERLQDQSRLTLSFSPSIAGAMLEALPFLVEYPYGCTEQTLNRFLPVVMTRRFLERMGADLTDAKKAFADAQANADQQSEEWKKKWGDPRAAKAKAPVFDDAELEKMLKTGVERLSTMQNSDGGWGWFSGWGERSWPHTTAVVVYGLLTARDNQAAIPLGVIDQGVNWLRGYQAKQIALLKTDPKDAAGKPRNSGEYKTAADNLDAFVYLILAKNAKQPLDPDMRDFLYRDRLGLSKTALAMFAIALHMEKATNALATVERNLRQYLQTDPVSGTAWLETPSDGWWWWYNDNVETQAWYLKLLARTDPKGATASGVAKYLLKNRRNGSYWRSTRDTAYAIEALADYAVASGETDPDLEVGIFLDNREVMRRRLTAKDILSDQRFVLEGLAVETGEHELRIERSGKGNVYFGGGLDLFSLEDPIEHAGRELQVERAFYKLTRQDAAVAMPTAGGTAVSGKVESYQREPLPSPFVKDAPPVQLEPGDLVEVELALTALNDYEYIVIEDMKAAGLEAVELQSGYARNELGAYIEYRDQKVVLFVRNMPRGKYTLKYRFRAEIPGSFSALPTFAGGMYATDLFANSDEMKVRIGEEGVY